MTGLPPGHYIDIGMAVEEDRPNSEEIMSKENHKHVDAEEFHESTCAGCGEQWGRDGWEKRTSVGDGWGGSAHYDCPSEDCDGTLTMHF